MFRHDYPYTDFHELNLDWFLRRFNSLLAEWNAMGKRFDTLEDEIEALREWFKNLDVSEEINNKLEEMAQDGTLKALLTFQRGSSISLQREAIITTFNCRYNTSGLDENAYAFVQSACSDGEFIYMMGYAFGYLDEQHIKVMKYSADLESKIAENVIEATHANGSCIFNGKLYITNSNKTVTVVNTDTLIVENVIDLSDISDIALYITFTAPYDGVDSLYIGSDTKWFILNTDHELLDTVYINYSGMLPNASGNACYFDGLVYKTGWPNVLFSFTLSGDLVNIYNIGTVQYDYVVGECEACFTINNRLYITCSEPAGWPTGTIVTQIFECNPKHGIYEFYKDDKYIYSTRTIYVNANYTGIKSDGTQEHPFRSLTWALSEAKALNSINRVVDVNLLSDMPELVAIAGGTNIRINFNHHTIYGLRLQRVSNLRLRQPTITYSSAYDYTNNGSTFMSFGDSSNIALIDCIVNGETGIKPFAFYYCDVVMQSLVLNNINTMGHFEVGKYLIGSVTHNLSVFADTTFGTEIQTRNTNLILENGGGSSPINQLRVYHNDSPGSPTAAGTLVSGVNLANFRWITVCVNIATKGSSVYRWHSERGTFDIFVDYLDETGVETAYATLTKTSNSITVSNVGTTGTRNLTITDIFIEN